MLKTVIAQNMYLHLAVIAVIGILAYSNTLDVPFQFDEFHYIQNNPYVTDPGFRLESLKTAVEDRPLTPDEIRNNELYRFIKQRYVVFVTYALNYRLHGAQVAGYHVVNIALHLLTALLVYLFTLSCFRTPVLQKSLLAGQSGTIAFLASLLFISHPLQTEAVTYLAQRYTIMAALFSLLCLLLYNRARSAEQFAAGEGQAVRPAPAGRWHVAYLHAGALASGLLAMTLPLLALLCELCFFNDRLRTRIVRLAPLFAMLLALLLFVFLEGGRFDEPSEHRLLLSRSAYLFTELRIIVTYLRLFFLPVGQSFSHAYHAYTSLFSPAVLASGALVLAVLAGALYLLHRSRRGDPALRIIAWGPVWFFAALSVESTIIPLPIPICEYRMYLPSVGLVISAATTLWLLMYDPSSGTVRRHSIALLVSLVAVMSIASYARNAVWRGHRSLWEDAARKNPYGPPNKILGEIYLDEGEPDKALTAFRTALSFGFTTPQIYYKIGEAHAQLGQMNEAGQAFRSALEMQPAYSPARFGLISIYLQKDRLPDAEQESRQELQMHPGSADAYYALGTIYTRQKRFTDSIAAYQSAIRSRPDHLDARNDLGGVYVALGRYEDALRELRTVLQLRPDHIEARQNLQSVTDLIKQRNAAQRHAAPAASKGGP
jgi:tetratricopeptide (TPR) repeat protein